MFWVFLSPKQSFAFLFLLGGVFFVALAPHGIGMGIGIGKADREVWALGGGFLLRLARVCKETQRKRERGRERDSGFEGWWEEEGGDCQVGRKIYE